MIPAEADVSLIVGKARARNEPDQIPNGSTDVVLRDQVFTVAAVAPSASKSVEDLLTSVPN